MKSYLAIVSALCRSEGWPLPIDEHRFAPPRRWRFDLCWPQQWVAVEVQGGLFIHGRHTQGVAMVNEFEKLNTAQLLGWVVLLVIPAQLTNGVLTQYLRHVFREPSHALPQ